MKRLAKEVANRRDFRQVPGVHNADPIDDLRHQSHVMSDEDDCRPEILLNCQEGVHHLPLHDDVQRAVHAEPCAGDREGRVRQRDRPCRQVQRRRPDEHLRRDDQIDLNELLREQFYLALPMKPLCRDDCAGLCSQCGTNLNTGTCQCTSQWDDPRLAPLKELK